MRKLTLSLPSLRDPTSLAIEAKWGNVKRAGEQVVGQTRLAKRGDGPSDPERVMKGREDYKLYYKLCAAAHHKGKPNYKAPSTPEEVARENRRKAKAEALVKIETVHVEKEVDPIERKAKFTFDRSNRPARPHGARPKGWVAKGCYTNPGQNK